MPVILEGLSRHEGLAHLNERILEIDIIIVDTEHDDIVPIVPNVLKLTVGLTLAQPDLGQGDHWNAVGGHLLDLVQREIFDDLRIETQ
jgi:hypothetical protein